MITDMTISRIASFINQIGFINMMFIDNDIHSFSFTNRNLSENMLMTSFLKLPRLPALTEM